MTSDGQKERVMDECRNFQQDMGKDETTTKENTSCKGEWRGVGVQMRERYRGKIGGEEEKNKGKRKKWGNWQ